MKLSAIGILLCLFSITPSTLGVKASSCVSPINLNATGSITTERVNSMLGSMPFLWLPLAEPIIQSIVTTYETPIQYRQALYQGMNCYNVAAMYHENALTIWGDDDRRICLDEFASADQLKAHEQVATLYAFAYSSITISPTSLKSVTDIMNNVLGFPMSNLDNNPDIGTPWGLAKALVDQMSEYARTDGWNADGSLRNKYNKMPFSDFDFEEYSMYKLKENRKLKGKKTKCNEKLYWEPLLETNYAGYFTKQEHVTPFAGYTGRLYGLTDDEYNSFSVPNPEYNYCQEVDSVLKMTEVMANDEFKKVKIETYDSKFTSLLPMQINWSLANNFTSFDFWFYDLALVTAMYDATMLVWREKVAFNAIRPTTLVHAMKGDSKVRTYAGPNEGVKKIKAVDWQPYIRTMPHAEFPSGSSCICTAYAETLQLLTGQDETGKVNVTLEVPTGSLKTERGVLPKSNITLTYSKWSEIKNDCGQSRLYGGMHFSKAVPAGETLCSGLALHVVDRAKKLKEGLSSGSFGSLDKTSITVKKRNTAKKIKVPACADSKKWYVSSTDKGCKWIGEKKTKLRCKNVPGAIENCPKTCNACSDVRARNNEAL